MKKQLLTLCIIIPFLGFSQKTENIKFLEKDKLSIQFRVGAVFDHYVENYDTYSPDLISNYENDLTPNTVLGLYYNLNKNFSLGIDLGHGKIYGENDFHFYEGDFEELNFNIKLNLLAYKNIEMYGRVGSGVIQYQSERNFFNGTVPISKTSGEALKSSVAMGLEYKYKKQWSVLFDATFNRVDDDNFDAWDDNIGNSKYFVTSVGLKYAIKAPSQREKDKAFDYKAEIKRRVKAHNNANIEPRLEEIENSIANHSHQINKEDLIIEGKETSKTKYHFFFETAEQLVNINSLERVIEIADLMKANEDYKVNITGYADSDASTILNEQLSKRRADNIKKYLISLGIDANRMSTFYKGEAEPLAPNNNNLNKQLNRRVDVHLVK